MDRLDSGVEREPDLDNPVKNLLALMDTFPAWIVSEYIGKLPAFQYLQGIQSMFDIPDLEGSRRTALLESVKRCLAAIPRLMSDDISSHAHGLASDSTRIRDFLVEGNRFQEFQAAQQSLAAFSC